MKSKYMAVIPFLFAFGILLIIRMFSYNTEKYIFTGKYARDNHWK